MAKLKFKVDIENELNVRNGLKMKTVKLSGMPIFAALSRSVLVVERDAKLNAPADTGQLRASISSFVNADNYSKTVSGIVGSNKKYAPFMEMGTGTFAGKPKHRPPGAVLQTWARRHGFKSGYQVAAIIAKRGGLEPRKYLEKALEKNKTLIKQYIQVAVNAIAQGK